MSAARRWRFVEPLALFAVALCISGAMWGRLWVSSPTRRGICGCGDPSLFQWFLAWPAHAISSGHSVVFSRDLFYPHGINLLANTSVLALGIPLAPVTWLWGPILAQNVALLLAVPVAAWSMDLLLRRCTGSVPLRVVLSLLYGCSPYVVASLAVSHLMTAWVGILPLIALGAVDAVGLDERRARRGQVLLAVALVVQFFVSTELLLLSALVVGLALVVVAVGWAAARRVPPGVLGRARRLVAPLAVVAVVLAVPTWYALAGPRSLHGNIWGPQFNPVTGGTSLLDLVRPHVTTAKLTIVSGYDHPVVQLQYLGWGLLAVAAVLAVWRWRDLVVRVAAVTSLLCLVLALSPTAWSDAPWRWIGTLPVLQNVLQFRIVVFALLGCVVILARGLDPLVRGGPPALVAGAAALAVAVAPVAVPVAQSLPLRTVAVSTPAWWRAPGHAAVVLSFPFPSLAVQSPLTWQAEARFADRLVGGSGPQGDVWRAGADAAATTVLDDLSNPLVRAPAATAARAGEVRTLLARDGVTVVVVPVSLRGSPLATGRPSGTAAVFFTEVLGEAPSVEHDAWVFAVAGTLPAPHLVAPAAARACARSAVAAPQGVGRCVLAEVTT